ncbi:MAG: murein hydrolase activator EnvC family protein [Eubacterium sp.]
MNKKILSLLMTAVLLLTSGITAFADTADTEENGLLTEPPSQTTEVQKEATTKKEPTEKEKQEAQKQLEDQQKQLEANLADAEKKLAELEKSSKLTEEYIDTLDRKIGYINEQLTILEEQNNSIQLDIDKLKPSIKKNQKQLDELSAQVEKTKKELDSLEKKFQSVYEAYCYRLRVMYVSGDYNILTALLSCKDISSFLTRYEMIKSVSKSDTELLKEVNAKMDEIVTMQNGYDEQLEKYRKAKKELDSQKESLEAKQKTVEKNSREIAQKKAALATDRAESDALLAELTAQNQQYTEFRNEDEELIAAVENEIQSLISGLKNPDEVTTAVQSDKDKANKTTTKINKSDVYSNSDAVLNMTYPVPGHYGVSAGFPNYSSGKYHGGIDFPCPTGSAVVAAQDGIVINVQRLDYSYGYYVMIYHGTDSKGRSVVTLYGHNSSILVSNGQSVKRGQQIAKSGSTGNSTGPHCHFEIRFDGERVNPTNYLSR